jgi:hypothetical protein
VWIPSGSKFSMLDIPGQILFFMNRVRDEHGVVSLKRCFISPKTRETAIETAKFGPGGGQGFAHKRKIPLLADRDAIVAGVSDDFVLDVCESALCFKWFGFKE